MDDRDAHALVTGVRGDDHVLEEGVGVAVPQHVDEPDEPTVEPGDDPPEAVALDLGDPVPLRWIESTGAERLRMHRMDLLIGKVTPPTDLEVTHVVAASIVRESSA